MVRQLSSRCTHADPYRNQFNLVRTGKYRQGDETKKGVVPPDEVCDYFSSFVDSLLQDRHGEEV